MHTEHANSLKDYFRNAPMEATTGPYGIVIAAQTKLFVRVASREDWLAWVSGRGTTPPQSSCGSKHPDGNPLLAAMTDPCDATREIELRGAPKEDPQTTMLHYPEGVLAPGYYRLSVDIENPEAETDKRRTRPKRGWKREHFLAGEIVKVEHRKDVRAKVEITEVHVMLGDANSGGPYCDRLVVGIYGPNRLDGTVVWMPSRTALAGLVRGALVLDHLGPKTVQEVLEMYEVGSCTALGALETSMGERPLVAVLIEALELMKHNEQTAENPTI